MSKQLKSNVIKGRIVMLVVDSDERAAAAVQYYLKVLHRPENEVIVLHCPEISPMLMKYMKSGKVVADLHNALEAEKEKWNEVKGKFEELMEQEDIKWEFALEPSSKPADAIVRVAHDKAATMIVMGSRGLGAIRRTLIGSVSDYVVQHAHCPVVVCRQ